MLVYQGMDIGTAKPSKNELAQVPHHLVDICDIHASASVADFQQLAREAISTISQRNAVPIVVGGSALYLRAITDEFEFPGTDPQVRARWEAELERVGAVELHRRLMDTAPQIAAEMQPANGRRIVRAFEVIELTGSFTPVLPTWTYFLPNVWSIGLQLDRAVMDDRITRRVHQMWQDGLVAEVAGLAKQGLRETRTASRAIGYRQALDELDGLITTAEAMEQTIKLTKRFARKQLGWFRRDHRIEWRDASDPGLAPQIVLDTVRKLDASS